MSTYIVKVGHLGGHACAVVGPEAFGRRDRCFDGYGHRARPNSLDNTTTELRKRNTSASLETVSLVRSLVL